MKQRKKQASKHTGPGGLGEAGRLGTQRTSSPAPGDAHEPNGRRKSKQIGWETWESWRKGHAVSRGAGAGQTQSQGAPREVRNGPQHPRAKAASPPLPEAACTDRHTACQQTGSFHHQPGKARGGHHRICGQVNPRVWRPRPHTCKLPGNHPTRVCHGARTYFIVSNDVTPL